MEAPPLAVLAGAAARLRNWRRPVLRGRAGVLARPRLPGGVPLRAAAVRLGGAVPGPARRARPPGRVGRCRGGLPGHALPADLLARPPAARVPLVPQGRLRG